MMHGVGCTGKAGVERGSRSVSCVSWSTVAPDAARNHLMALKQGPSSDALGRREMSVQLRAPTHLELFFRASLLLVFGHPKWHVYNR